MNKISSLLSVLSVLAVSSVATHASAWGFYGSSAKVCTPAAVYWESDNGGQVLIQCKEDNQAYYFQKASCTNPTEHSMDDLKQAMTLANSAFLSGKPLQFLWASCGINRISKMGIFAGL